MSHQPDMTQPADDQEPKLPPVQFAVLDRAPLPTRRTLRQRSNIIVQGWRFVVNSVRMFLMTLKGHG